MEKWNKDKFLGISRVVLIYTSFSTKGLNLDANINERNHGGIVTSEFAPKLFAYPSVLCACGT